MTTVETIKPAHELEPQFNPTGMPESEIYSRDGRLSPGRDEVFKPHSDYTDVETVDIYRLEQRERVESGIGLIASRAALHGTLGDVGGFNIVRHLASHHDKRMSSDKDGATPFVSFSTDPEFLARQLILDHGFGIKDGSDSVIVKAAVHPSRILSTGEEAREVLLVGGVAPEEYKNAQELDDFVKTHVKADEIVQPRMAQPMPRDEAIAHWRNIVEQQTK